MKNSSYRFVLFLVLVLMAGMHGSYTSWAQSRISLPVLDPPPPLPGYDAVQPNISKSDLPPFAPSLAVSPVRRVPPPVVPAPGLAPMPTMPAVVPSPVAPGVGIPPPVGGPLPVAIPMAPPPNVPQFLPSSGWTVQANQMSRVRGLDNIDLPCMMATNYDNGYSLRFSGSRGRILAMAVDFRQEIFVRGRKYFGNVSVDGVFTHPVTATAFSKSTLIFNMREVGGFYGAISGATQMMLDVEGNGMIFRLSGMIDAVARLESCYGGPAVPSGVQGIQGVSLPVPPEPKAAGVAMGQHKAWEEKVSPVPARVSRDVERAQERMGPIWSASAGDDLKATLEGWASRAGVQLDWQATGYSKVVDDISVTGSFEDAVQALMARNATALGLDANMRSASGGGLISGAVSAPSVHPISHPVTMNEQYTPQPLRPPVHQGAGFSGAGGGRWSAPIGANLQQVLQGWSKQAGVELVWESSQGFIVKSPVTAGGSYEDALQSLLGQYANEKIRPNAQLNNDPVTGRRVLFIQSSRVL